MEKNTVHISRWATVYPTVRNMHSIYFEGNVREEVGDFHVVSILGSSRNLVFTSSAYLEAEHTSAVSPQAATFNVSAFCSITRSYELWLPIRASDATLSFFPILCGWDYN
jgi:hypothetical protein